MELTCIPGLTEQGCWLHKRETGLRALGGRTHGKLGLKPSMCVLQRFRGVCLSVTRGLQPDGSPPGSPIPGILQARILEWVAIAFSLFYMVKGKFLWSGVLYSLCLSPLNPWRSRGAQRMARCQCVQDQISRGCPGRIHWADRFPG